MHGSYAWLIRMASLTLTMRMRKQPGPGLRKAFYMFIWGVLCFNVVYDPAIVQTLDIRHDYETVGCLKI
jgi:hypothetical protein